MSRTAAEAFKSANDFRSRTPVSLWLDDLDQEGFKFHPTNVRFEDRPLAFAIPKGIPSGLENVIPEALAKKFECDYVNPVTWFIKCSNYFDQIVANALGRLTKGLKNPQTPFVIEEFYQDFDEVVKNPSPEIRKASLMFSLPVVVYTQELPSLHRMGLVKSAKPMEVVLPDMHKSALNVALRTRAVMDLTSETFRLRMGMNLMVQQPITLEKFLRFSRESIEPAVLGQIAARKEPVEGTDKAVLLNY